MSRRAPSHRCARAVLALAVGATSLVGLAQASAAPPAIVITGVSPAIVEADVPDAFGITLSGKGFGRDTVVKFDGCTETPVVVPPSTVTATKLVVKPPSCGAGPVDVVVTKGAGTSAPSSRLKGKLTFLKTPTIVPAAPASSVTPATGSWAGGSTASVELVDDVPRKAVVQVLVDAGGVVRRVPAKVDAANAKRVTFKVPASQPGVQADVAVIVAGIQSKTEKAQFTYVSTIRTSPAAWVKGAAAPAVKVDGAGFTKEATVEICGVEAPLAAGTLPTARTLVVTPPAWADLAGKVDADKGGVCTVQVTVGGVVSAITAGSTFTYAAY